MNGPFVSGTVALQRSLADVVAEYEHKLAAIPGVMKTFSAAGDDLKMAATIGGTYGNTTIDVGNIYDREMQASLLKSAWRHVYDGLNIERIASALDKQHFKQALEQPAPFTLDNIRGTFGKFVADPRGNILRGLAEVFCGLDQAYKSHDKVKIGVAGLPKRVIIGYVDDYGYGKDKVESILNALAAYQGKPLVTHRELSGLMRQEDALVVDGILPATKYEAAIPVIGRGLRLRRFKNKNAHMIFEPATLRDVNRALAEFYGDVLPDTTDEKPAKPRPGTSVSKDLQYYPTPLKVVRDVLCQFEYRLKGEKVLEPSCGCGRFLDALRKAGAKSYGIEVDARRASEARAKGHSVLLANFLETAPSGDFDRVVMNPPFYGKHYAKHVDHALKFLKPGGTLVAILPATARYDHGLVDGKWDDLPVGSFSESGTNINTTVLTISKLA